MKKIIITLVLVFVSLFTFANNSFDKTINYQYNNAKAYIGEILYLMPISGTWYTKDVAEHYHFFMQYEWDENDYYASENNAQYYYKFNPYDYRDCRVSGTHYRHIEGHKFYVNDVVRFSDYEYTWVFYLTDLNTGDNLKFVYHGSPQTQMFVFNEFPFITMKHFNYCKSLVGTNLVYATHMHKFKIYENEVAYCPTFTDINTGEKVNYTGNYAKWKIKNAIIDKNDFCISFIVTDGTNTIKIPYNIQYSIKTKQPEYLMAKYSAGVRVFPEMQWNEMVKLHGLEHMSLIMNTEVSSDMTVEEKYLAGGRKLGKGNISSSDDSVIKQLGKVALKSTKDAVNAQKDIVKGMVKALW